MKVSENKYLNKKKFFNIQKGYNKKGYFFIFPLFAKSPKKILNWDLSLHSFFLAWGRYFIQINIYQVIKDTNIEVFKENMMNLINLLKSVNLKIKDMQKTLDFLNKNAHLTLILKNYNINHPYIKSVLLTNLQNQDFIESISNKS